ncbi:MAG: ATP synthase F1 subunit delta [Candidatus Cryptobacteroides sp.]
MNEGTIASRYAKALLEFAKQEGVGEEVYSQACVLLRAMEDVPLLRDVLTRRKDLAPQRRREVLATALGCTPVPALDRFVSLLETNSRMEFFDRMLWSFILQYRKANNIKVGHLVTAFDASDLKERMEKEFAARTGADVRIEARQDPDIIGGFIFDMDGRMMDASVRSRLMLLRKELIETDKRII